MDFKKVFLPWFLNFLIKSLLQATALKKMSNTKIAEELHKTIIRKSEKTKVHS